MTEQVQETILTRMYQYSRAIYRSIKDLIDPWAEAEKQLEYRRDVLAACEECVERLAKDPRYFAHPDRTLFQDIRRYFPITAQAQVAWAVQEGVGAAVLRAAPAGGAELGGVDSSSSMGVSPMFFRMHGRDTHATEMHYRGVAERHVLDEANRQCAIDRQPREIGGLVVVRAAQRDAVDLDRREAHRFRAV